MDSNIIKLNLGKTEVFKFPDGKVTIEHDKPLTVATSLFYLETIKHELLTKMQIYCMDEEE